MDVCSRSHHFAYGPYRVLSVLFANHFLSGAGLTLRTSGVFLVADKDQG